MLKYRPLKYCWITILSCTLATGPALAGTVAGFGGATEVTQLLNNVQLIQQAITGAQQLTQIIKNVEYAEQQLKNLENQKSFSWGTLSSDLNTLSQSVSAGQALGYKLAQIDSKFANLYPTFRSPLRSGYQDQAKTWTTTNVSSIKAAIKSAGLQESQFSNEQSALEAMQNQASTSTGALQVMQAGTQLAANQSQQLMKLRQLYMAEMQAQNAALATEEQRRSDQQALTASHLSHVSPTTPTWSSKGGKE